MMTTRGDKFIPSDIFRCSVCHKADLFPDEPPIVMCSHCNSVLQVPEIVPCPKCGSGDSYLVGEVDADSENTTVSGGDQFAALFMFGVIGRLAVDLAPAYRERMAAIKRSFTGGGAYFSCRECEEHWALQLPTVRACMYAAHFGTRRDAALACGGGAYTWFVQDLTGMLGTLTELLQDEDESVRAAAAASLGVRGNVLLIPTLAAAKVRAGQHTESVFNQSETQIQASGETATAKCRTSLKRKLSSSETAVFMSWEKHLGRWPNAYMFPEIPERKISGATGRYAEIGPQDVLVGLIDHTTFGSAKAGFLMTTSTFFWNYPGGNAGRILYTELPPSSLSCDPDTGSISIGSNALFTPASKAEGDLIANFLYDVSYSLKMGSEGRK